MWEGSNIKGEVWHGKEDRHRDKKINNYRKDGADTFIYTWLPNILKKPLGILYGHGSTVVDLAVNEKDQHLISVCTSGEFRIWDLQCNALLYIFADKDPKPGARQINTFVFDNKNLKLIAGSSVVDVWTLTQLIQDTQQVPCTHERPIIVLVYNQIFQQLLSICSESVIKVWDFKKGSCIYQITNVHGSTTEVTAAAIDSNGFYFVTGAYDGSLQTWDLGSGRELKAMTPVKGNKDEKQSIIHVCFHRDPENTQIIVAVNLKGTIKILQSGKDDKFLNVIMEFTVEPDPLGRTPNPTLQPIGKSKKFPRIKPVVLLKSNEYSEQLFYERQNADHNERSSKTECKYYFVPLSKKSGDCVKTDATLTAMASG
ncbi:WD repeat-containing 64 [Pelobates cultripes]|uniref:WD repeat-containing 64 n=1 Tax=Pelobates cultripes TaxID=61616 RepID=A0AAD1S994_PELCU|nr:WD repeat-containing 64 [Pelobates cultripes]